MNGAPVHVMVAVVRNHRDQTLVALRRKDSHQGGLWEFPGGKREAGEPPLQALHRELHEETGLRLLASHPLCRVEHRYSDKHVLLDVHLVSRWSGEAHGSEGQQIAWRERHDLREADFPAANAPIVRLLQLPPALSITPQMPDEEDFLALLRRQIESGRELIQLRQPQLPPGQYRRWFEAALDLAAGSATQLLFNNPPEYYDPARGGCGFHASSRILAQLKARPVPAGQWFSASCHSLAELCRAEALGVDFALLSPVAATGKHTAADLLGWRGFRHLADQVSLPVLALGGLHPSQAMLARSHGAFGLAGVRNFCD